MSGNRPKVMPYIWFRDVFASPVPLLRPRVGGDPDLIPDLYPSTRAEALEQILVEQSRAPTRFGSNVGNLAEVVVVEIQLHPRIADSHGR